jgi:hypothetical protein
LKSVLGRAGPGAFPPEVVVAAKSIACALPQQTRQPVSRLHAPDIVAELIDRGIVAKISAATIWRWLEEDALKPWKHRMWIYPRDPRFAEKASPVLDLYERKFDGHPSKLMSSSCHPMRKPQSKHGFGATRLLRVTAGISTWLSTSTPAAVPSHIWRHGTCIGPSSLVGWRQRPESSPSAGSLNK